MARTKTTPRRILPNLKFRRRYVIEQKLENPKVVKFGNKQFTVRYKWISKKDCKCGGSDYIKE